MLVHQTTTEFSNAISYDARTAAEAGTRVGVYSAEVAAGGDARVGTPSCSVPANQVTSLATSLEDVASRNPGHPCVFAQASFMAGAVQITSPDPNEWWGNAAVSFGTIGNAPVNASPRTAYLSANQSLRVAFPGGSASNAGNYYLCGQLWTSTSPRNCSQVGSGTYAIASLGDARVMTFAGIPAAAAPLSFDRVFVERGGQVFYGFRNKLRAQQNVLRLNGAAGGR